MLGENDVNKGGQDRAEFTEYENKAWKPCKEALRPPLVVGCNKDKPLLPSAGHVHQSAGQNAAICLLNLLRCAETMKRLVTGPPPPTVPQWPGA